MSEHHDKYPPSRLPALAACPQFVKPAVEDEKKQANMDAGTRQHQMLAALLLNQYKAENFSDISESDKENVEWAHMEVLKYTVTNREVEMPLEVMLGFDVVTWGTADIVQPPLSKGDPVKGMDYKKGRPSKSYKDQMMAYAIGAMLYYGADRAEWRVFYGAGRCYEDYSFTLDAAQKNLAEIIDAVESGQPARACDFCDWCGNQKTCPAVVREVVKVVAEYETESPFDLSTYHGSQITKPEEMAQALELAKIVKKWAEAIEHHVRAAIENGMDIPGWKLTEPGETQFIEDKDIPAAFEASGLNATEFLGCCKVSIPQLRDVIAPFVGMKTGSGKKVKTELANRLGALLQTGATTLKLMRDTGKSKSKSKDKAKPKPIEVDTVESKPAPELKPDVPQTLDDIDFKMEKPPADVLEKKEDIQEPAKPLPIPKKIASKNYIELYEASKITPNFVNLACVRVKEREGWKAVDQSDSGKCGMILTEYRRIHDTAKAEGKAS